MTAANRGNTERPIREGRERVVSHTESIILVLLAREVALGFRQVFRDFVSLHFQQAVRPLCPLAALSPSSLPLLRCQEYRRRYGHLNPHGACPPLPLPLLSWLLFSFGVFIVPPPPPPPPFPPPPPPPWESSSSESLHHWSRCIPIATTATTTSSSSQFNFPFFCP